LGLGRDRVKQDDRKEQADPAEEPRFSHER
jgi:hypothetical protein